MKTPEQWMDELKALPNPDKAVYLRSFIEAIQNDAWNSGLKVAEKTLTDLIDNISTK